MKTFEMPINSTRNATIRFTEAAGRLGTSVSSVAWAVEEGNSVTLSGEVLSSDEAQITMTSTTTTGCSLVRCIATMANSEVIPEYFKVRVFDPTC